MKGRSLVTIFLLSQILDILSTYIAVGRLNFQEANPIASTFFSEVGMLETMALKGAIALFLVVNYFISLKTKKEVAWSFEKSLQVGGIATYLVATFNFTGVLMVI